VREIERKAGRFGGNLGKLSRSEKYAKVRLLDSLFPRMQTRFGEMKVDSKRTPLEWFQEAARVYIEGHQACIWCGGCHRVFRSERGSRVDYYCYACDFYVSHDRSADDYVATPGRSLAAVE
jgi:formamidopyrimidine-DNA glycosylase